MQVETDDGFVLVLHRLSHVKKLAGDNIMDSGVLANANLTRGENLGPSEGGNGFSEASDCPNTNVQAVDEQKINSGANLGSNNTGCFSLKKKPISAHGRNHHRTSQNYTADPKVTLNSCVIFFHLCTWMELLFIWHQDSLLSPCLHSLGMGNWLGLIQSPADDCREARGLLCCSCIRSFWMEIAGSSLWMPNMLAGCCQCCCLTMDLMSGLGTNVPLIGVMIMSACTTHNRCLLHCHFFNSLVLGCISHRDTQTCWTPLELFCPVSMLGGFQMWEMPASLCSMDWGKTLDQVIIHGHWFFPSSRQAFWDWTWDEHAHYDLPAQLRFINAETNQTVHYIGISQVKFLEFLLNKFPLTYSFNSTSWMLKEIKHYSTMPYQFLNRFFQLLIGQSILKHHKACYSASHCALY